MAESARPLSSQSVFWFVGQGSVLRGPYSDVQIRALLSKGEFSWADFTWRAGFQEWRPFFSLADFNDLARPHSLYMGQAVVYPSVAIPGKLESARSEVSRENSKQKKVLVHLSRTQQRRMALYEWVFAFVMMLSFGFIASWFAVVEVEQRVSEKIHLSRASFVMVEGTPEVITGEAPLDWPMVEPLLSAPGMESVLDYNPELLKAFRWTGLSRDSGPVAAEHRWAAQDWGLGPWWVRAQEWQGFLQRNSQQAKQSERDRIILVPFDLGSPELSRHKDRGQLPWPLDEAFPVPEYLSETQKE